MADATQLARRMLEVTDAHDWASREALLTPDCEFVTPIGAMRGPAATTAYSAPFTAAFSGDRHEVEHVSAAGDVAIVEGHWVGTHTGAFMTPDANIPATGKSVRIPFVLVLRTAGELASSVHVYFDQLAFMAQLGLMGVNETTANRETVRRLFDEVINLGKLDAIESLLDPDFETVTPQGALDGEGFAGYVEAWRAGFPDVRCEVEDLTAEGDRAGWAIRATGTHTGDFMGIPATGNTVDFDSLNLATFRDGRVYRHTVMMDLGRMMQQLGVTPA